ncbi:hypothetical protein [Actinoallomurus sp. NPDC052274]|uniref:hypothetical protein n=1 Tax=Actinoallomurus sp. NPDC052274 TaxID=3155420 RepID=UPI00342603BF
MTISEDPFAKQLRESIAAFYNAIDRLGLPAMTSACELLQLDRLVRRYPQAARKSLELHYQDEGRKQQRL